MPLADPTMVVVMVVKEEVVLTLIVKIVMITQIVERS
jgi:hypothetical protein